MKSLTLVWLSLQTMQVLQSSQVQPSFWKWAFKSAEYTRQEGWTEFPQPEIEKKYKIYYIKVFLSLLNWVNPRFFHRKCPHSNLIHLCQKNENGHFIEIFKIFKIKTNTEFPFYGHKKGLNSDDDILSNKLVNIYFNIQRACAISKKISETPL